MSLRASVRPNPARSGGNPVKKKNCMKMINHTKNAKRGFKGRQCHVQKFKRKCRRWRQLGCDEDSMGGLGMALSRQAHGLRGCFGWAGGPATQPACSTFATISRASRFARFGIRPLHSWRAIPEFGQWPAVGQKIEGEQRRNQRRRQFKRKSHTKATATQSNRKLVCGKKECCVGVTKTNNKSENRHEAREGVK